MPRARTLLRHWLPAALVLGWSVRASLPLVAELTEIASIAPGDPRWLRPAVGEVYEAAREDFEGFADIGFARQPGSSGAAYFQAQYALAPIRVHKTLNYQLNIGRFSSEAELRKFVRSKPIRIVARYPGGVVVLRNPAGR